MFSKYFKVSLILQVYPEELLKLNSMRRRTLIKGMATGPRPYISPNFMQAVCCLPGQVRLSAVRSCQHGIR
jgi:hypothetical protein